MVANLTLDIKTGGSSRMSDLFIMRRANGDLLVQEVEGRSRIPVWSSQDAVARYKERNPELIVFFPARLDRRILDKLSRVGYAGGLPEFSLLPDHTPDARMDQGRPIKIEDLFPQDLAA
jgi:hypothetical protein